MPVLPNGSRRRSDALPTLHQPALTLARALCLALAAGTWGCQSRDAGARPSDASASVATTSANARPAKQEASVKGPTLECRISRVADGDSVYCGSTGRIRLLMIDAPELSQGAAGRQAQSTLAELMPVGTHVTVETDVTPRDTYQRILGYVYLDDGRMVNEEMARSGYATALVYAPNVRYAERIRRAEKEARDSKRGLWATPFFDCSPRDYRAGRCGGDKARSRPNRYHGKS